MVAVQVSPCTPPTSIKIKIKIRYKLGSLFVSPVGVTSACFRAFP
jgi:hypothetical protein